MNHAKKSLIPLENIQQFIYLIRGQKVMLSTHLSDLYGVEPRALGQAVKRNRDRFPDDFMFQLTGEEFQNLKSQIVISSWGGLRRAAPYAFTEQGVRIPNRHADDGLSISGIRAKAMVQTSGLQKTIGGVG